MSGGARLAALPLLSFLSLAEKTLHGKYRAYLQKTVKLDSGLVSELQLSALAHPFVQQAVLCESRLAALTHFPLFLLSLLAARRVRYCCAGRPLRAMGCG